MRFRILSITFIPTLQGTHFPQDSSTEKSVKNRAVSTMQVESFITTRPPDPIIAPASSRESKSTSVSSRESGRHAPEGPPIWIALNSRFPETPPPMSKTIVRSVVPMGTSTRPTFFTVPARAKTFVPFEPFVPIEANHLPPFRMIAGTFAKVSTLFRTVGCPHRPASVDLGGLIRGIPLFPSREYISAVDSPQTKAPAPG